MINPRVWVIGAGRAEVGFENHPEIKQGLILDCLHIAEMKGTFCITSFLFVYPRWTDEREHFQDQNICS